MAKNKSTVYLGYEDEEITGKHVGILSSTVNKIGGTADWPSGDIKVPACPLCGIARPLVVQLYAPLENSQFHRTLYVFGCLNPACSQSSKGWLCIRTQHLDTPGQGELISATQTGAKAKKKTSASASAKASAAMQTISWCDGADDWGEDMDTEADEFEQQNEENGNVVAAKNDNSPMRPLGARAAAGSSLGGSEEEDDDESESTSMENDLICGFGLMELHSPQNAAEDPNANCAGDAAAAVADALLGGVGVGIGVGAATATICAEIEGPETDVVLVETPKKPERDLIALLKHTPSSVALGPLAKITDVTLKPYFVAVDIEQRQRRAEYEHYGGALSADHIRELYQEYKRQDDGTQSPLGACHGEPAVGAGGAAGGGAVGVAAGEDHESYEKTLPAHGDVIFHQFVVTLQQNPGQILRYSRDTLPLLIAPLMEPAPKCQNCSGETICEVQILSTLIPRLRLQQNNEAAPIEYGNVLVFTCLKSCWDTPDKMRYERVIVQAEK